MIDTIIFDLGGVVIQHKSTLIEDIILNMFPDSFNEVFSIWTDEKINLYTGKITSGQFVLLAKNKVKSNISLKYLINQWISLYKERVSEVNIKILYLVNKLRNIKYNVIVFTDTIDIHDEYNKQRNIYTNFNKIYMSYKLGFAKAQGPSSYSRLLQKIKKKPNECIFIDDLESNILNARSVGLKSILYKNVQNLEKQLKINLSPQSISFL